MQTSVDEALRALWAGDPEPLARLEQELDGRGAPISPLLSQLNASHTRASSTNHDGRSK